MILSSVIPASVLFPSAALKLQQHIIPDGPSVHGGRYAQIPVTELLVIMDQPVLAGKDQPAASPPSGVLDQMLHQIRRNAVPPVFRDWKCGKIPLLYAGIPVKKFRFRMMRAAGAVRQELLRKAIK